MTKSPWAKKILMSHSLAKAWVLLLTGEKNPYTFINYTSRFHITNMLLTTITKKLKCRKVYELLTSTGQISVYFSRGKHLNEGLI